MKSSEYYEHQLNEEQLRSDQLQDQIDTLQCQLDDLKAERKELVETLRQCYCAIQGYKDTNRLHDDSVLNRARLAAKTAIEKASETP